MRKAIYLSLDCLLAYSSCLNVFEDKDVYDRNVTIIYDIQPE